MRGLALAAIAVLSACEQGSYRVVVHVPGGADEAARVEISVLRSCGEIGTVGDPPAAPVALVEVSGADAPAIGALAPGSYGLYARAWDPACSLFAAGCDGIEIEGGQEGTVDVFLARITPQGCNSTEMCDGGKCVPRQADGDADADTDSDADGDADCTDGELRKCGSDVGDCRPGFQECWEGQWSDCEGEQQTEPETCDGIDTDCDGVSDDLDLDAAANGCLKGERCAVAQIGPICWLLADSCDVEAACPHEAYACDHSYDLDINDCAVCPDDRDCQCDVCYRLVGN